MSARSPDRSAPPAFLEFILKPIERFDSRLRRIAPIRPEGLLGLEVNRYRGPEVRLADGTEVRRGDLVLELHLLNSRVAAVGVSGWQAEGARLARADMAALAAWWRDLPPERRPVAVHGETILTPFLRWGGFEIRDAPNDFVHRLRAWYLRGLLARWSPEGRRRLARGRSSLKLRIAWLSAGDLERKFGSGRQPRQGTARGAATSSR